MPRARTAARRAVPVPPAACFRRHSFPPERRYTLLLKRLLENFEKEEEETMDVDGADAAGSVFGLDGEEGSGASSPQARAVHSNSFDGFSFKRAKPREAVDLAAHFAEGFASEELAATS